MKTKTLVVTGVALGLGIAGVVTTSAIGSAATRTTAVVDPADFANPQPNPYFPLKPGSVFRYRGTDDGKHYRERVTITHKTKVIEGVKTRVVHDVLRRADGSIAEATHDWYAADNGGTVWYFGEDTATYDRHGNVKSREGSWKAGRDGAVAGVIMPASPKVTDAYRQEYYKGQAEDQAWIVQTGATVKVPYRTFHRVVRSFEWSRLERDVVSVKLYGRGVGIVRERDLTGGTEKFNLVGVTRP